MTKFLRPSVAGFLLQKELDYLDGAVANPKRPFVAIVGGSKVSSKIGVIESLIGKVDKIILGCALGRRCHLVAALACCALHTYQHRTSGVSAEGNATRNPLLVAPAVTAFAGTFLR